MLAALRQLVVVLVAILGLAFLAAFLYQHVGSASAHRAYSVVFYIGGGVLLLFAILTRGAEGRAYSLGPVGLSYRRRVRERQRALNPTGVLMLARDPAVRVGRRLRHDPEMKARMSDLAHSLRT